MRKQDYDYSLGTMNDFFLRYISLEGAAAKRTMATKVGRKIVNEGFHKINLYGWDQHAAFIILCKTGRACVECRPPLDAI